MKELAEKINPNWHSVFIANILVLGLLLLFYDKLPPSVGSNLIQALVIYTLGNSLIGNIQGIIFRAKGMKNGFNEPLWIYISLYAIWFVAFLWYVFTTTA
ncbi:MAG TPA: hypothetical protein DCZ48_06915 [Methylococcaceae bacterium]|nr:hypothetical protein [Methylococcaceae bacterium]